MPAGNRWGLALIALPATIFFGPVAVLGAWIGINGLTDQHSILSGWIFLTGLGGVLGLTGIWVRLLTPMQNLTTRRRIGMAVLLLSGVASLLAILFLNGPDYLHQSLARGEAEAWLTVVMLHLAMFGLWLAISTIWLARKAR